MLLINHRILCYHHIKNKNMICESEPKFRYMYIYNKWEVKSNHIGMYILSYRDHAGSCFFKIITPTVILLEICYTFVGWNEPVSLIRCKNIMKNILAPERDLHKVISWLLFELFLKSPLYKCVLFIYRQHCDLCSLL